MITFEIINRATGAHVRFHTISTRWPIVPFAQAIDKLGYDAVIVQVS